MKACTAFGNAIQQDYGCIMADIVSFPINRAKVGVSVTSYQQADNQRLEIERANTQNAQASSGVDGPQGAGSGRELQSLREAARAQRVEQTARPDKADKRHDPGSENPSARRGQSIDIKA